ncbi:7754_t:CDS:2 [Ambispora gerdemannii]|uniref:7754_t:CDS:1 n=1 Tax=Ambispora gerdemannii TaxID=144530 RepID=A0A9N8ZC72_9GLOM|nr:7754_t:CDS:2 [Ambispora gerdemannii]
MADQKISVLFVCLGNICRSPMAEAVFAHTIKLKSKSHFFRIDSAGTGEWHVGAPPDPRSVKTCKKHNVPVNTFARQITKGDFHEFDYILLKLFGDYDPEGDRYIRDPYYGGIDGFEKNFQQVTRCSEAFLLHLNII